MASNNNNTTGSGNTTGQTAGKSFRPAPMVAWGYRYSGIILLIVTVLVAFGIFALDKIDKNEFPSYTVREGLLVAVYPGATPEMLENEVMKPLENYVFGFKEVDKSATHTQATQGMVIMFVNLDDNVDDTDAFWNKLTAGTSTLKLSLPPGVLAVEVLSNFGNTSAVLMTMQSTDKTYRELGDYMDDLVDRLRRIESVGDMSVTGKQQEQIAVYLDPERLRHYGISEESLAATLFSQGFATTAGDIRTGRYTSPIKVKRPLNSVREVEEQIVLSLPGDGGTVRLKDVAKIVREYPVPTSYITNNGEKCILLSLSMKEGHNIVAMGSKVQKVIDEFKAGLPDDVVLFNITDQPVVVNNSVIFFLEELLIAVAAVLIVIMILLPLRVALIAASTIPITIFIALGIFYAFGIELNTVTLACLIVSLGMIVDNSVVIIDNYVELTSQGVDRKSATLQSATVFLKAIIAATLAISVTFFPFLLTLKGMFRDFLTDFPWGITIILFASLVVAEMLVPYLQYKFIKPSKPEKTDDDGSDTPDASASRQAQPQRHRHLSLLLMLQNVYDKLIGLCFRFPRTVLVVGIATVVLSLAVAVMMPIKLMPIAERNQFAVEIYLPAGTPLTRTSEVADSLSRMMSRDKRVKSIAIFHGSSSPRFQTTYTPQVGGPNFAQFIVNTESNAATIELLNEFEPVYNDYFPDAYVRFKQLDYSTAAYPIELQIQGNDRRSITMAADTVMNLLRDMADQLWIVRQSSGVAQMVTEVVPDETVMNRTAVNSTQLEATLALRYSSGVPVATLWDGDYGTDVVLKAQTADTSRVDNLAVEPVGPAPQLMVPLEQFARISPEWTESFISHRNGVPEISIFAQTHRDLNAIDLTRQIKKAIDTKVDLPDGVTVTYAGEWGQTWQIIPELAQALMMAVFIIFFILLYHYKDVRLATLMVLSLLLTIPGAVIGLLIQGVPLSLTCTLGVISLMGILVRNAIIMLDYAIELQQGGMDVRSAIFASAKRRMRPIFLTSSAASMGVLPMVISPSALWQPMGTVIFWGTIITMVYILTFIPIAYWKIMPDNAKADASGGDGGNNDVKPQSVNQQS